MKRFFSILLIALLITGCALAEIDLSAMSYSELVALKDKINRAIWDSDEWQEVTVPQGLWEAGKDIPFGKWTIKAQPDGRTHIEVGALDESGAKIDLFNTKVDANIKSTEKDGSDPTEYTVELSEGDFVLIDPWYGAAIFTPYAGKPDLGFK